MMNSSAVTGTTSSVSASVSGFQDAVVGDEHSVLFTIVHPCLIPMFSLYPFCAHYSAHPAVNVWRCVFVWTSQNSWLSD